MQFLVFALHASYLSENLNFPFRILYSIPIVVLKSYLLLQFLTTESALAWKESLRGLLEIFQLFSAMMNIGTTVALRILQPRGVFVYPGFVVQYLLFLLIGCLIVTAFGASLYSLNYISSSGMNYTYKWSISVLKVLYNSMFEKFFAYTVYFVLRFENKKKSRRKLFELEDFTF